MGFSPFFSQKNCPINKCGSWCAYLWSIWNCRNISNLPELMPWCTSAVQQTINQKHNSEADVQQTRWVKPTTGKIKCNVNAAFSVDGIIRVLDKLSVAKGKAYGRYHVMLRLKDQNVDHVIFKLDYKNCGRSFQQHKWWCNWARLHNTTLY